MSAFTVSQMDIPDHNLLVIKTNEISNELCREAKNRGDVLTKSDLGDYSDQSYDNNIETFKGTIEHSVNRVDQRIPGTKTMNAQYDLIPLSFNTTRVDNVIQTANDIRQTRLELPLNVQTIPSNFINNMTNLRELILSKSLSKDSVRNLLMDFMDVNYNDLYSTSGSKFIESHSKSEDNNLTPIRTSNKYKTLTKIIFMTPSLQNNYEFDIFEHGYKKTDDDKCMIKACMFEDMNSLTCLLLPHTLSLPPRICRNCSRLQAIDLGDHCVRIGSRSFENCSELKSVVGISKLKYIGKFAFKKAALETVNNWQNAIHFHEECFAYCDNLKFVCLDWNHISPSHIYFANGIFRNCSQLRAVDFNNMYIESLDYQHPNDPENYENQMFDHGFYQCRKLEYVNFNRSVQRIGHYCFQDCISLCKINMPTYITEIGDKAFGNCYNLRSLVIPFTYDLQRIGAQIFNGPGSLWNIEVVEFHFNGRNVLPKYLDVNYPHKVANGMDYFDQLYLTFGDYNEMANRGMSELYNATDIIKYNGAGWLIDALSRMDIISKHLNIKLVFGGANTTTINTWTMVLDAVITYLDLSRQINSMVNPWNCTINYTII